ncbi:MAG: XTP/dITP diphosphatase [Halobacteria archaeon]|nr:XTP/dITP diphosphatase [Halobacteria archaeon]
MIIVTGNPGKAREIREILGEDIEQIDYDYTEIQSPSLKEISEYGARECYERFEEPCLVDDSGLFVDGLEGFPGPYSSYVYGTIGNQGILRTMRGIENRDASFRCVASYCDSRGVRSFKGRVDGVIAREERGQHGFGYDPIFEHVETHRTFGEMKREEKNEISHRRRAFEKFAEWYREP